MDLDIVQIKEYSRGTRLDFKLTKEEQKYLESNIFNRGEERNIEVFFNREGQPLIHVGPYAGIIQLKKKRLHFSTKVDTRLFYMLSFLKNEKEFLYDPNTPIEIKEGANFFDIIGNFFLTYLCEILKRGLLRKYVRKQENLRYLKGKILIKQQIKENLADKSRFFCDYENLTFDNLENQIVLSALNALISLVKFNFKLKSELSRLEFILKDYISLVSIDPKKCDLLRFNRINRHYEDIIKLSKLILEEMFIRSVYKGVSKGFNFIVNMNRVYQDFLTEIIEEVIDQDPDFKKFEIEREPRFRTLVKERALVTKPDILIRKGAETYPLIIDAKYKTKSHNQDYYQIIAYSLAIKTSKVGCLIYPYSPENKLNEEPYTLIRDITDTNPTRDTMIKIYSKRIDLYGNSSENIEYEDYINKIKGQMKKILKELMDNLKTPNVGYLVQ